MNPEKHRNTSPPPPAAFCDRCGEKVRYVWIGEEMGFLIKRLGMDGPGWHPSPCDCATPEKKPDRDFVRQARSRRAGIKRRFLDKSFKDFKAGLGAQTQIIEVARTFAERFKAVHDAGTWLLFMGRPGTGKTLLACIIAQEVIRAGYTVRYVKAREVFRRIKESWRPGAKERETEIIRELVAADLLVMDEIGVQFGSATEQGMLYDILDGRYERKRPMIATSNRDYGGLSEMIGPHNLDRFQDRTSDSRVLVFDWPSYRSGL